MEACPATGGELAVAGAGTERGCRCSGLLDSPVGKEKPAAVHEDHMIVPSQTGLDRYIALLEVEFRRLASDQEVRDARAANSNEVAVASEASAGKRRCLFFRSCAGSLQG